MVELHSFLFGKQTASGTVYAGTPFFFRLSALSKRLPPNPQERIPVPALVREALDPVRIVSGDYGPALELLGKNRKKPLLRQAIVLCANQKRIEALPYLKQLEEKYADSFQSELQYAFRLLQNTENVLK